MKRIPKNFIELSRKLRKKQTPWEAKLWQQLRGNRFYGIQFKRQVRIGNYIADFYCASRKLVIELDGAQHNHAEFQETDKLREKYFESQGLRVVRFWNNELEGNMSGVLEKIREEVLFNPSAPRLPLGASPLKRRE